MRSGGKMGFRAKPHRIVITMVKLLFLSEMLMLLISREIIKLSSCRFSPDVLGQPELSRAGGCEGLSPGMCRSLIRLCPNSISCVCYYAAILHIWLSSLAAGSRSSRV